MFSKATIYRHATRPTSAQPIADKRKNNKGRPRKLTEQDEQSIIRQIGILRESIGSFTTKRLRVAAGITADICDETIRRVLHSSGYGYYHSRKKGLLHKTDLKQRLKFARTVKKRLSENCWKEGVSLYLDGAGFQHKYNPFDEARSSKTMTWRSRGQGLDRNCLSKGSHVGSGGRVAHFIVAIAYNKGAIFCEQYPGRINGEIVCYFYC